MEWLEAWGNELMGDTFWRFNDFCYTNIEGDWVVGGVTTMCMSVCVCEDDIDVVVDDDYDILVFSLFFRSPRQQAM